MPPIPKDALDQLNAKIKERGSVDREDLLAFLALVPTSDAQAIAQAVRSWLQQLHNDPTYERISFPPNDIDAIIGDLDSYGRVRPETIYDFKANSSRELQAS